MKKTQPSILKDILKTCNTVRQIFQLKSVWLLLFGEVNRKKNQALLLYFEQRIDKLFVSNDTLCDSCCYMVVDYRIINSVFPLTENKRFVVSASVKHRKFK